MLRSSIFAALLLSTSALADGKFMKLALDKKDLWATLSTTQGDIVVKLFAKDAPKAVANFAGLAEGEKEATDDKGETSKKRLYDGTLWHRVIPEFMIQGGDPTGTGRGNPGFTFADEFSPKHNFEKPGQLAMANRGIDTNGSQFFITVGPAIHLNNKHTIFGEVVSGYDVAVAISKVKTAQVNRPEQPVKLSSVTITDKAPVMKKVKK